MRSIVERSGRGWLIAVALALAPMRAEAMLRTVITKPQEPESLAPATAIGGVSSSEAFDVPVFAAPHSCDKAAPTIDALEGAIVEAQAQYWAYLMKQPGFAASGADLPGSQIINSETKAFFYSRLRFWLRQDSTPRPSPKALKNLNDVSQAISMMTVMCIKNNS
jgi:hypothetical protein